MADGVEVAIHVGDEDSFAQALARAVDERVASRLFAQDPTEWGPDAESEAKIRLSWTSLATASKDLVPEILSLRDEFHAKGLTHVVLCGMGGSSLAPEVICKTADAELTVLDSSHPDQVRRAIADRLTESIVVVSSKSGSTVETDSLLRSYVDAFEHAGLDPADHVVIVTDPGSPFDEESTEAGYRVFRADPHVGGRYSALTAFGLVPSGLAGADIGALLGEAAAVTESFAVDDENDLALRLGVALGTAANAGVDKLVLWDASDNGVGDWIEQLVAESTGKLGKGILPVVVPHADSPNADPSPPDAFVVTVNGTETPSSSSGWSALLNGGLGAQFLLWETAVAIAGWAIGINPFDQPDVESAKAAARKLLDGGSDDDESLSFTADGISAYGTEANDLAVAIDALLSDIDGEHGYLAVQAYLDREAHPELPEVRDLLARRTGRPVTFGWGPRFLHSTGQYHKGGPRTGVYLQLTDTPEQDLAVPGREFTFGSFIAAQAAGDAHVLQDHQRPVLRLHIDDASTAMAALRTALS